MAPSGEAALEQPGGGGLDRLRGFALADHHGPLVVFPHAEVPDAEQAIPIEVVPSSPYASLDLPKVAIYGLQLLSESLDLSQQAFSLAWSS